jgi:hypothetical protein
MDVGLRGLIAIPIPLEDLCAVRLGQRSLRVVAVVTQRAFRHRLFRAHGYSLMLILQQAGQARDHDALPALRYGRRFVYKVAEVVAVDFFSQCGEQL